MDRRGKQVSEGNSIPEKASGEENEVSETIYHEHSKR